VFSLQEEEISAQQNWGFHINEMAYSSNNTLLHLKCLDTENAHEYFRSVGGIAGCLMEYHLLKTQAVRTWRKGFPAVERRAKAAKGYILEVCYFIFNTS
jgi:hypothetical protein